MSRVKPCPVCGFDDDLLICWGKVLKAQTGNDFSIA